MTTPEKCEEIMRAIVKRCAEIEAKEPDESRIAISFHQDVWGVNTLTVHDHEYGHTHVGCPDGTFDDLMDQVHALLVHHRGLSWV